jgi:hypothetical protein
MSPDYRASNITSWASLAGFVQSFPDESWAGWKALAERFIAVGREHSLDEYFRGGQSMHDLLFSTTSVHGLPPDAPKVRVSLHPPDRLTLAYEPGIPAAGADARLEYTLSFDDAVPTFRRLLNHLWTMTTSEPIPQQLRAPFASFVAPILPQQC